MEKLEAMVAQYNKVFDENGQVKACGRNECINLINMCKVEDPSLDFGNPFTGMMNVENIRKFREKNFVRT